MAKAGLMLRASTAADAAHAMVHWLPQGEVEFIWRAATGATAGYVWATAAVPWPPRLRLQRTGNLVTALYSTDGTVWSQVGAPQAVALPATALGGPAVCAHDSASTGIGVFSNISISGDRDGDGILDDYETHTGTYVSTTDTGTDPDDPDSDDDGFSDGAELASGTDPLVSNSELVWQTGATPGGSGTWDATTANWRLGSAPTVWLQGKSALFGGTAGTVTVDGGAPPAAALVFNAPGFVIAGPGPLALTAGADISVGSGSATVSCPLGATPQIDVTGGGQLNLTGNNATFAGTLVVDGATQLRGYNSATGNATGNELGAAAAVIALRSGSQLRWFNAQGSPAYPAAFRLDGSGIDGGNPGVLNNDSGSTTVRTITLDGSIELEADATIATQNSGAWAVNRPVSGPFNLTFDQAASTSTISGPLLITALTKAGAGTLKLTSSSLGVGTITCLAGTLDLNPAADTTFAGILAGSGVITKTGAQTLALAGPNTFGTAGGTFTFGAGTANVGTLRLAHPQALGNHARILLNSGQGGTSQLELAGGHTFPLHVDTVGRNTAPGNIALRNSDGANTLQGNITITATGGAYYLEALAGSSLTIAGNLTTSLNAQTNRDVRFTGDGDFTLQGAIADSATATPTRLSITKQSSGTLRLTGSSTHTLATQVNGGTLRLDGTFTASTVNVAAGATLAGTGTLPAANLSGALALAIGQQPLDITGTLALANATLHLTGSATAPVHPLAHRGALTGSFATITGLPDGYTLDPNHQNTTIALVRKPTADYEIWAASHQLPLAGSGAPAADPERDGLANSIEFTLGLDPTLADPAHPSLPRVTLRGNELRVSFTRLKTAAANGFLSTIEWSADLAALAWTPASNLGLTDHGDTETVTIAIPAGATRIFARLRVVSPTVMP